MNVFSALGGFFSGIILSDITCNLGYVTGLIINDELFNGIAKPLSNLAATGMGAVVLNNLSDSVFSTSLKVGLILKSVFSASSIALFDKTKKVQSQWLNTTRIVGIGSAILGTVIIGSITGLFWGIFSTSYVRNVIGVIENKQLKDSICRDIYLNNIEHIKKLIEKDPDIVDMVIDEKEASMLHYASYFGNFQIVKVLIEKKAKIRAIDIDEQTALHYACQANIKHTKVIELLTYKGDILNAEDKAGNNALHLAVLNENIKIVEQLIKKKIECNLENKEGLTPYELAGKIGAKKIAQKIKNRNIVKVEVEEKAAVVALISSFTKTFNDKKE